MGYSLGIDLGTTFTAAAVAREGRATSVPLGTDRDAMPTAVYVIDDGTTLVGEPAVRRGLADPTRLAREFKRRVGDPTPILVGGVPWSAEALSAEVLRSVVETVTAAEGGPPDIVTVTHPANWGAFKRDVLEQAVRLAGIPAAHLLSEPEAAAIAYARREHVEVGEYLAVYDLGGGTFDVTIVRRDADGFDVVGQPDGLERLGGIDFDEAVFGHVTAALGDELAALDPADPAAISAMAELRANCIRAKEALSADTEATISVPLPTGLRQVRLTRAEFEDMVRGPLGQTIQVVERTITNAGIPTSYLSRVLLVGGSSRIPLVGQLVASALARPVTIDAHPKHVVASGAALHGLRAMATTGSPAAVEPLAPIESP